MTKIIASLLLIMTLVSCETSPGEVHIVLSADAGSREEMAADELYSYLSRIYPGHTFVIRQEASESIPSITLGTLDHLTLPENLKKDIPQNPEGFLLKSQGKGSLLIVSRGEEGLISGIYQYLETLGCRFLLDTEYIPELKGSPDFTNLELSNEPLAAERYANPWEVYLEGCSSWDLEDWKNYITHVQRMGYNSLLVHAYGNDPMFSFDFNGLTKPVGHLTSSVKGRGWGQKHVNDVRRMPGGQHIFDGPAFGSERAIVADDERVQRSQEFMGEVFRHAAERGIRVNFALDFDILSNIPQELVLSLPEKDRFLVSFEGIDWMKEKGGSYWIPRPDTPGGYQYYKAQLEQVLKLYPEISTYTLWRRRQKSIFCEIRYEELPAPWKKEFDQFVQEHPGSDELPQSTSVFAQRKLAQAYREIFDELGRKDMKMAIGSWHLYNDLDLFKTLDVFIPEEMKIIILDSEITRSDINLQNAEWVQRLSRILGSDRYVPIIWAHHDDGEYVGSPFPEFRNFSDMLDELQAGGFGVIHWINRPLDLFFINHMRQVWKKSRNETALESCHFLAKGIWYDDEKTAQKMGIYLHDFWQNFPPMSRANSAYVFDRPLSEYGDPESILRGVQERIAYLEAINTRSFSHRQLEFHTYCLNYEVFLEMFIQNQLIYEKTQSLLDVGQWDSASKCAQDFVPEKTLEQLARTAEQSFVTHGDMGLLFSLGVRWLPHFINLKQSLGMEALRLNFHPTQHEPLAQMPGRDTYFIDENGDYWKALGEEETGMKVVDTPAGNVTYDEVFRDGIEIIESLTLSLNTIGDRESLPPGKYKLELLLYNSGTCSRVQVDAEGASRQFEWNKPTVESLLFTLEERSIPEVSITTINGEPVLCGIILKLVTS